MQSTEFTKPVTAEALLQQFESRSGQTIKLEGMSKTQLEDVANHIRTKIHTLTDNLHFGHELENTEYQKAQSMLDVVNQAIREADINTDPKTQKLVQKIQKTTGLQDKEKKEIIGDLVTSEDIKEGVEQQSELILAAKDMMDKVTGYLEDLASMKTEGMLELADRIRDEMGADKADAFTNKIQPAIESAEQTLTQTREELEGGVRILTGEETASEPMGEPELDSEDDLDTLDTDTAADEFGAADAEAGGTEPEGREQRESREVFETTSRIISKLAGR